jgi:hypothetical protein
MRNDDVVEYVTKRGFSIARYIDLLSRAGKPRRGRHDLLRVLRRNDIIRESYAAKNKSDPDWKLRALNPWLPPEHIAEYRELTKEYRFSAKEARAVIEKKMRRNSRVDCQAISLSLDEHAIHHVAAAALPTTMPVRGLR